MFLFHYLFSQAVTYKGCPEMSGAISKCINNLIKSVFVSLNLTVDSAREAAASRGGQNKSMSLH